MRGDVTIRKVDNGYIVRYDPATYSEKVRVFRDLDDVFTDLLDRFEHRLACGKGYYYGRVVVDREGPDESQEV